MLGRFSAFSLGLLLVAVQGVWAAPRLTTQQPVYDFGSVHQGENVRHSFVFTNTGDEPLLIDRIRSSCGCTAALVSADKLLPGQQGELKTNFDSARFRGEVEKTIYLYSNDALNPVQKFSVRGEVQELFGLVPRQVNFGLVAPGDRIEKSVSVSNRLREDLRTISVETTSPQLGARFPDQLPGRGTAELKVFLQPKPGQARFSGYALIRLQGEKVYELRLPVYGRIAE